MRSEEINGTPLSSDAAPVTAPGSFAKLMATPAPVQPRIPIRIQRKRPQPEVEAVSVRPPEAPQPDRSGSAAVRTVVRTDATAVRPYALLAQIPPQPAKRRPERYAFQFWADQITRLKKLKQVLNMAQDPEERAEITLSDLVRQAVDDYLARQTHPAQPTQQIQPSEPHVRTGG